MYSYSSKRVRENELFTNPETVSNVKDRMVFRTFPVTSGFNMEAEPRNKRFPTNTLLGSGFQSSGTTRMPDRVELYEGNRLLSDEQIQRFISNTVLPHHRTLINSKGGNRPTQPSFQKKIKTNHAPSINMGVLLGRPALQGNPVFISVPQEAQRGSQGSRMDFPDKTQRDLTGFPGEFTVPRERQGFVIPRETLADNFRVPLSTAPQAVNSHQEDISYAKKTSEGNSKYPRGIQEMTNCFPKGSEREIFRVPAMSTEEIIHIPQGNGTTQETIEKFINFPQGTHSLSHGTSRSEEIEDDIIIIHEGTPEELIGVVQETLQEIMSIPQGTSVPQKTVEVIMGFPQGITVPQGPLETTIAIPQGSTIPQQEIIKETIAFPQETTIPQEIIEETTVFPHGTAIPHEIVEEIIAIPQGISVIQETLHEIMGIPRASQGISISQTVDIPQEVAIPLGTQGQTRALQNQNKCGGHGSQEQQSFWKSQVATSINVSVQHQPCASYNQSVQSLIPQTVPVQENPKQSHTPGGTTRGHGTDTDPLLAPLSTHNRWGGTACQEKVTARSVMHVTDPVNNGYEFSGNRRKRRMGSSSETTNGKRQRLELQTSGNSGRNECLSGRDRLYAANMVLPGRNSEDEFFASIEKCLELSSEASPCGEKYAFLEDFNSASLESFPTEVIDDIYKDTFESDWFLTSGDDFVLDSLSFLKQGVLDNLC